jgi:hypothetical protein
MRLKSFCYLTFAGSRAGRPFKIIEISEKNKLKRLRKIWHLCHFE